jgi:hypothetical protein
MKRFSLVLIALVAMTVSVNSFGRDKGFLFKGNDDKNWMVYPDRNILVENSKEYDLSKMDSVTVKYVINPSDWGILFKDNKKITLGAVIPNERINDLVGYSFKMNFIYVFYASLQFGIWFWCNN